MALSDVRWKGIKVIEKMADILPSKIAGKRLRSAYRYALMPVKSAMLMRIPRDKTGRLKHSIDITIKGSQDIKDMFGVVGPRRRKGAWNQQGWHAHLVEQGTKKHTITAGEGKLMPVFTKSGFTGEFTKSIEHPGAKGTMPFKRSIDSTWRQVGKKVSEKVSELMVSEIKKIKTQYGNIASRNDI